MAKKQAETITGKALDDLVDQCLIVTDRNGIILRKDGNPVSSFLSMEYQSDYGKIRFDVQSSAQGNGSYDVEVKDGRKIIFKAQGNYTASPYNSEAVKYVSGDWEKQLKKEYKKIKGR
ncbi:MAG: hypothetical protein Q7S55_03635 [Nanoarchaeota archaeon]|nr:hypothetical protein [Nanoarchaeota archaeon]